MTFERRQRIPGLLWEQPGVKVSELAQRPVVPEGTSRNDLTALEEEGHLIQVRGGAVLNVKIPLIPRSSSAACYTTIIHQLLP